MAGTCESGKDPSGSIKWGDFLTSWEPVNSSRRTLLHGVSKYLQFDRNSEDSCRPDHPSVTHEVQILKLYVSILGDLCVYNTATHCHK